MDPNEDTEREVTDSLEEQRMKTPFTNCDQNVVSRSFLSVLEDKNRFIGLLKKQIQNQKVQLQFYLHRGLSAPKIIEMAKDCITTEAEENLPVNLALVKFCNQTGLKSRLAVLHERMYNVENNILKLVNDQQEVIQEVFNKFNTEELVQNQNYEIFGKILDATCILRSELEAFRTCCNRLIVLEDERNDLVEQVYSIPVSERVNYNALLATLHEKTRLEKEIIDIKNEQKELLLRLNSVSPDEGTALAKHHKRKVKDETMRLKEFNCMMAAKINELEQDLECKKVIESKMDKLIEEYQDFRVNATQQLTEVYNKLGSVIEENEKLTDMLNHYKEIEDEVKTLRTRLLNFNRLEKERDQYKVQFEELQAIRDSYAQIVQKPFDTLRDADRIIMQQKEQLKNMDEQLYEKRKEVLQLRIIIDDKYSEIKELTAVIDNMNMYNSQKEDMVTDGVNTPITDHRDVGCNYNFTPPATKCYSRATNCNRMFLRKSEDKFLRINELNTKKVYSKAVPVTTLNVHTINNKGLTETLRAVVESTSPVDGIIQLTNNSAFTVRLTCGSQMETQNLTQTQANNVQVNCPNLSNTFKCSTIVMDEYELMKDSSNDALVARMPSLNSLPQGKLVERQKTQIFVDGDKCEEITIDSIYEPDSVKSGSDVSQLDISYDDLVDIDDEDNSITTSEVSFKDRLKRIVDNSLCRHVFEKLFQEQKK